MHALPPAHVTKLRRSAARVGHPAPQRAAGHPQPRAAFPGPGARVILLSGPPIVQFDAFRPACRLAAAVPAGSETCASPGVPPRAVACASRFSPPSIDAGSEQKAAAAAVVGRLLRVWGEPACQEAPLFRIPRLIDPAPRPMRGQAWSLSRAVGAAGRPPPPPTGAQAAVRLQGRDASAGDLSKSSSPDKLAYSANDEEAGAPAASAAVARGGAPLSRRARMGLAIAATVLVLSVTVAVVVGVTQAQKSKGGSSGDSGGSLNGGSVPAPPPVALSPPPRALQPPPGRPGPPAAVPPPLGPPPAARPPQPAPPSASPPAAPPPSAPQLPPPLPPLPSPPRQLPPASPPLLPPLPPAAPFPIPAGSVALWGDDFTKSQLDSGVWAYDLGAPASAVDACQLQVRRQRPPFLFPGPALLLVRTSAQLADAEQSHAPKLQEYTDSPDNLQVQDGQLLIIARKASNPAPGSGPGCCLGRRDAHVPTPCLAGLGRAVLAPTLCVHM